MISRQHPPLPTHARLLLQLRRIHVGLSLEDAARLGGYSADEWKHVETGRLGPDESMLERMADVVDLRMTTVAGFPSLERRRR